MEITELKAKLHDKANVEEHLASANNKISEYERQVISCSVLCPLLCPAFCPDYVLSYVLSCVLFSGSPEFNFEIPVSFVTWKAGNNYQFRDFFNS